MLKNLKLYNLNVKLYRYIVLQNNKKLGKEKTNLNVYFGTAWVTRICKYWTIALAHIEVLPPPTPHPRQTQYRYRGKMFRDKINNFYSLIIHSGKLLLIKLISFHGGQCYGSRFVGIRISMPDPGLWIPIDFLRIRIQLFFSMRIRIQFRIRILREPYKICRTITI